MVHWIGQTYEPPRIEIPGPPLPGPTDVPPSSGLPPTTPWPVETKKEKKKEVTRFTAGLIGFFVGAVVTGVFGRML